MENVSLKLESGFAKQINQAIKRNNYSTKTEFIREAIREKIKRLEKEELLMRIDKLFGSSKHKTTDEDLHRAGERVFEQLERRLNMKSK